MGLTLDFCLERATMPTMTNDEKFTAIVERLKAENWLDNEHMISVMIIISYLDKLQELGIVEYPFNLTPLGKNITAICEEFDWQPTDAQIQQFVSEMVDDDEEYQESFILTIREYRDNREKLLDKADRLKNED